MRKIVPHDPLVKALQRLLKIIDSGSYRDGTHLSIAAHPAVDDARALLATHPTDNASAAPSEEVAG